MEQSLQEAVALTVHRLGGEPLRGFLHGDWLNVPLHSVLTDIPIGSWTATIAFDALASLSPSRRLDAVAASAHLGDNLVKHHGIGVAPNPAWSTSPKTCRPSQSEARSVADPRPAGCHTE